ncbi:MAG: K(+)-transporting ATPase subunit F [Pseudozobellia sp.]|nr:K(+)-transporting ATPase subunit F [Pseudozobellia sp.]
MVCSTNPLSGSINFRPMILLLIVAVAVFIYLVYAIAKPEKF